MRPTGGRRANATLLTLAMLLSFLSGCVGGETDLGVPREGQWGIYSLDLETEQTQLIFSTDRELAMVRLNPAGDKLVFSMSVGGVENEDKEICTLSVSGDGFMSMTSNGFWDLYPTWSDDGEKIAFLSFRDEDLDIYVMDSDGGNESLFVDTGYHDADIHWGQDGLVFTSQSAIWIINGDGTDMRKVTSPPSAGEWGTANLPYGDYDPQLHPLEGRIVFERLEDDDSPHGNYNIFSIGIDGKDERRLTGTGYSQGYACWSHSGEMIVFSVAAIGASGVYDIYLMNSDGSDQKNITPSYYPADFLCHAPIFSLDDSKIYFVGQWWG